MASGFPREGSMIDSFLNAFFNSILMLLYYQYYYSLSFIYFVILSFPCFIILALIALSELFCVIFYHLFWCWVTLLLTVDHFFMFNLLSHPFIRRCLVQSQFIHIFCCIFYAVFMYSYWPWLIQWHSIVLAIILMIYPWSQFLNSNFIVFLAALFWSFNL